MTGIISGTVSVAKGTTAVTLWNGTPLDDINLPVGSMVSIEGVANFVAVRVSTTAFTLQIAHEGTGGTGLSCVISANTPEEVSIGKANQSLATVMQQLSALDANGQGLFYNLIGVTGANDPGPGQMAFNNATPASITEIYLDILDANTNQQDVSALIDLWANNTVLTIRSIATNAYVSLKLSAVPTVITGYRKCLVAYVGHSSTLASEPVVVEWNRIGATGATGAAGTNGTNGTDGGVENILIGARFGTNPWQRGTTFSAATVPLNSDDTYLADRWVLLSDGNDIVDVTQDTDGSLLATVQTINKQFGFVQIVEAKNCASIIGGVVSMAARLKATGLTKFRLAVLSWTGTADAVISDVISTWAGAGAGPTWASGWTLEGAILDIVTTPSFATSKGENIAIDTASAKQIAVVIWLDDLTGAVGDSINIEWVSVVSGATHPAQPVFSPTMVEKMRCMWYYQELSRSSDESWIIMQALSTGITRGPLLLPVPMRVVPTAILTALGNWVLYQSTAQITPTSMSAVIADKVTGYVRADASGLTADSTYELRSATGYSTSIKLDSEL